MKTYRSIPKKQVWLMAFPFAQGFVLGISMIEQNRRGEITVYGTNGDKWPLGIVKTKQKNLDLVQAQDKGELLAYMPELMKKCRS